MRRREFASGDPKDAANRPWRWFGSVPGGRCPREPGISERRGRFSRGCRAVLRLIGRVRGAFLPGLAANRPCPNAPNRPNDVRLIGRANSQAGICGRSNGCPVFYPPNIAPDRPCGRYFLPGRVFYPVGAHNRVISPEFILTQR